MAKINMKSIIAKMKDAVKDTKPAPKPTTGYPVRDMRQEAMDMGSHGAAEFFKENQV